MAKKMFKGFDALAPLPAVMVSCGDMENSNIITIAWTGIVNSDPPYTYISVRKSRFSHDMIEKSGEFVINMPNRKLLFETDKAGVISGSKVNKFEELGLTKESCGSVACPMIAECPVNLECRVIEKKELPSHDMFLAEILAVHVDESLMDESGRINMEKADLFAYIHGSYVQAGTRKLGSYGYSVMKKSTKKKLNEKGSLREKIGAGLGSHKKSRKKENGQQ